MRNDESEAPRGFGNELCSAVDNGTNRGISGADDVVIGDDGTQPVREVNNLRAGNTREEVLVSAGKADDFVWEYGAANDDLVVIEDQLVEANGHVAAEKSFSDLLDF